MTVKQLIEQLSKFPEDALVFAAREDWGGPSIDSFYIGKIKGDSEIVPLDCELLTIPESYQQAGLDSDTVIVEAVTLTLLEFTKES